ncbi:MAG: small subunit ribosomal protein [Chloroflexota bacterium]|nr:small subunit ribosomal protein [Chloroflexota bacterium]
MGQKVHPIGFRLGINKERQARWYADDRTFATLLHEDLKIRGTIIRRLADAGVPRVDIERSANQVGVTIHAAKPGIVIGKGGAKVEELRKGLEAQTGKKVRITISEIRQPELNATLLAQSIADQLIRRVAFRRAMKQAVIRSMRFGAKGVRVQVSGRLGGSEMSRREWEREGRVPLHTLRADIDYGQAEAHTTFGLIGVKAWIYKGDVVPGQMAPEPAPRTGGRREPVAAARPIPVAAEIAPAPEEDVPIPEGPAIFEPDEDGGNAATEAR